MDNVNSTATPRQIDFAKTLLREITDGTATPDQYDGISQLNRRQVSAFITAAIDQRDRQRDAARRAALDARIAGTAPAAAEHAKGDVHIIDGTVYRVKLSQAGRFYALRHVGNGWAYDSTAIRTLTPANQITPEEAAAFGHQFGECCYCAKELTDPLSVASGIGPVCARQRGIDRQALVSTAGELVSA